MTNYTVKVPISIKVGTKKRSLNLNTYRNAHYHANAKQKALFTSLVLPLLKDLPSFNSVVLIYTLHLKKMRRVDLSNVLSIVDKYFQDALVEAGKIPDDSCHYVPMVVFQLGELSQDEDHAIVEIKEINDDA